MFELNNKTAIVTGAGRGIGKAIAIGLAKSGVDVVVSDINLENADTVSEEIKGLGRMAVPFRVDVSNWDECQNMVKNAYERFKKIDILINNAGINRDAMVHKMTKDQWNEVINVDLTGAFNCIQPVSIIMRDQGFGRIINISSASWQGNIGQSNYSSAKAGLIGLTKTLARELARKNITVNAICPGFIDTDMTRAVPNNIREVIVSKIPMGRMGDPCDIANLIIFLSSDEASYITGEVISVGGGLVL